MSVDLFITLTKIAGDFLNDIVILSEILRTSVQMYSVIFAPTSGLLILTFCFEAAIFFELNFLLCAVLDVAMQGYIIVVCVRPPDR